MKRTLVILSWGIIITALFISIFYVVTTNITSYFMFPPSGSILRGTASCKPVWVTVGLFSVNDVCLKRCETFHGVSNYKIESLKCFCDLNNCKSEE